MSIIFDRIKFLGKGGFAKCFEFRRRDSGETFAIKVVHKASLSQNSALDKLKTEIHIHASLDHPQIISFRDTFEDPHFVYLLMDLGENSTLSGLTRRRKVLSEREARFYVYEIFQALQYLRHKKIIHRDLKLSNLFLDRRFRAKLGDFGLSAQKVDDQERRFTVCGTPNYIAPEVFNHHGRGHSYEVDVWSLGVITYAILLGSPPFETDNVKKTYKRIINNDYQFPPGNLISKEACQFISCIFQTDPDVRLSLDKLDSHEWLHQEGFPPPLPQSTSNIRCSSGPPRERQRPTRTPKPDVLDQGFAQRASPSTELTGGPKFPEPLFLAPQKEPPLAHKIRPSPRGTFPSEGSPKRPASSEAPVRRPNSFRDMLRSNPPNDRHDPIKLGALGGDHPANPQNPPNPLIPTGPATYRPSAGQPHQTSRPPSSECGRQKDRVFVDSTVPFQYPSRNSAKPFNSETPQSAPQPPISRPKSVGAPTKPASKTSELPNPQIWVSRWVDFSSKYGCGYYLSDGKHGVYFNDSTKIFSVVAKKSAFMYASRDSEAKDVISEYSYDDHPPELSKKVKLMRQFRSHILFDEQKEGSENGVSKLAFGEPNENLADLSQVYVRKWIRTKHSILFQLSNHTIQMSFFDGSEILLTEKNMRHTLCYFVTKKGTCQVMPIGDAFNYPQYADLAKRLKYCKEVLAHLIGDQKARPEKTHHKSRRDVL